MPREQINHINNFYNLIRNGSEDWKINGYNGICTFKA